MKRKTVFLLVLLAAVFLCGSALAMQLFVRTPESRTITLEVEATDSIEAIKAKIQEKEEIPPERQLLYYNGTKLNEGYTLSDYNIAQESILELRRPEANGGEVTDGESFVGALGGPDFAEWASGDGVTIVTLNAGIDVLDSLRITSGSFKLQGSGTIGRAEGYTGPIITVDSGTGMELSGSVILDGGAVWKKDGADSTPAEGAANVGRSGSALVTGDSLTISGNAVLQNNDGGPGAELYGNLTMTGGTIRNMRCGRGGAAVNCRGHITVSGGTITGNGAPGGDNAIVRTEYGSITISGGEVSDNSGSSVFCPIFQTMTVTGGRFLNNRGTVLLSWYNMNGLNVSGGTFTGNSRAIAGEKPIRLSGGPEFTTETDAIQGTVTVADTLTCTNPIRIYRDSYSLGEQVVKADSPELLAASVAKFGLCSTDTGLVINSDGKIDTNPTSLITNGAGMVAALGGSQYATWNQDGNTGVYTVTLRGDVTRAQKLFIESGSYKLQGSGTISRAEGYTGPIITINEGAGLELGGSVVLDGGAVWKKDGADSTPAEGAENVGRGGSPLVTGSSFTLSENAVLQNNAGGEGAGINISGSLTMTGGTIRNMRSERDGAAVQCNGNIIISGGMITGNGRPDRYTAIVKTDYGSITISGGEASDNSGSSVFCPIFQTMTVTGGRFLNNRGTVLLSWYNMNGLNVSGGTFTGNSRAIAGEKPIRLSGGPEFTTETDAIDGTVTVTDTLTCTSPVRIWRDEYRLGDRVLQADTPELLASNLSKFALCPTDTGLLINSEGRIDTNPTSLVAGGESFVGALGGSEYATWSQDGNTGVYTVTLLGDVTRTREIFIESGSYRLQGSGTISRTEGYTGPIITVDNGAGLELSGSVILDGGAVWKKDGADSTPAEGAANVGRSGSALVTGDSLTISGNAVLQNNDGGPGAELYGNLTMTGGTIRNMRSERDGAAVQCNGNIVISGGMITGNGRPDRYTAIVKTDYGSITISGGEASDNSGSSIFCPIFQDMTVTGGRFLNNQGTVLLSWYNMNGLNVSGGTFTGNSMAISGEKPINLSGSPEFTTETDAIDGTVTVTDTLTCTSPVRIWRDNYVSNDTVITGTDTYTLTAQDSAIFMPAANAPEDILLRLDTAGNRIMISRLSPVLLVATAPEQVVCTGEPVSPDIINLRVYLYEDGTAGEEITDRYTTGGGTIGVRYQYRLLGSTGSYTDGLPVLPGDYSIAVRTSADNLNGLSSGSTVLELSILPIPVRVEAAASEEPVLYDGQEAEIGTDFSVRVWMDDGTETEITDRYTTGGGTIGVHFQYRLLGSTGGYTDGLPVLPGDYSIAVTTGADALNGLSSGSTVFELSILPIPVRVEAAASEEPVLYDGQEAENGTDFSVRVWLDDGTETEITNRYTTGGGTIGVHFQYRLLGSTGGYTDGLPVLPGDYSIAVTTSADNLNGLCSGSTVFELSILPIPIRVEAAASEEPVLYDGQEVENGTDFSVRVWLDDGTETEITDRYTVGGGDTEVAYQYRETDSDGEYTDGLPADGGTYTIVVSAAEDEEMFRAAGRTSFELTIYRKSVTVSFLPNGGTGDMEPVEVMIGTDCVLPENRYTRAGYHFTGWKAGSVTYTNKGTIVSVQADMELTAQWEMDYQRVSLDTYDQANGLNCFEGGGQIHFNIIRTAGDDFFPWEDTIPGASNLTSEYASELQLEAIPNEGYVFIGWFVGETRDAYSQTLQPTDELISLDTECNMTIDGNQIWYPVCAVFAEVRNLTLPANLTEIGEEAFQGVAATVTSVPEGCTSIGDLAFRDSSMSVVTVPDGCELGDSVFDGCERVILIGSEGSDAKRYCEENNNCWFRAE